MIPVPCLKYDRPEVCANAAQCELIAFLRTRGVSRAGSGGKVFEQPIRECANNPEDYPPAVESNRTITTKGIKLGQRRLLIEGHNPTGKTLSTLDTEVRAVLCFCIA